MRLEAKKLNETFNERYTGHGTDACLHYTLNDIMLQMTQVFIFTFVVQWRLVLL